MLDIYRRRTRQSSQQHRRLDFFHDTIHRHRTVHKRNIFQELAEIQRPARRFPLLFNTILSATEIANIYNGADEAVDCFGRELERSEPDERRQYLDFHPHSISKSPIPTPITSLTLTLQYNDGFVAWINGRKVARANAPRRSLGIRRPRPYIRPSRLTDRPRLPSRRACSARGRTYLPSRD